MARAAGITLLEVLVACGILVLGLSGLAGLLAATSSRLGEASNLDRAETLLANATAEILNRRLCALESFQAGVGLPGVRTACLGELEQRVAAISSLVSTATTSAPLMSPSSYVASRIDVPSLGPTRSFFSQDRLQYRSGTAGLPVASLPGAFAQEAQEGTCWGGLLTLVDFLDTPIPYAAPVSAPHPPSANSPNRFRGVPARLDVAVFKKPVGLASSENAVLLLTATSAGFTLTGSSADVQSAIVTSGTEVQKRFLPGCSFVLAMPPSLAAFPNALPQGAAMQGLAVLDRWNGARVAPQGLKLSRRYFDTLRQRLFYVAAGMNDSPAELTQAQIVSVFSDSAGLSDGSGARTKTVGAYTIRLMSRQDMKGILSASPAGWPTTFEYLSATAAKPGAMWACNLQDRTFVESLSSSRYYLAVEVAVSPTWYRIQSSWCNVANPNIVNVIFTDPGVFEFPRQGGGAGQLRIAAFRGMLAVESLFLRVE